MVIYVGDLCEQRNLIDIDHQPLPRAWLEIARAIPLITGNTTDGLGWPSFDQLAPDRSRVLIVLQILQQGVEVVKAGNRSFRDIEQEAHRDLPNNRKAIFTGDNLFGQRRVGTQDGDVVYGGACRGHGAGCLCLGSSDMGVAESCRKGRIKD